VFQSFGVTLVAFATVAVYTLTQDLAITVRLATVAMVLSIAGNWRSVMRGPAWPDERRRRVAVVIRAVAALAGLLNVFIASVRYLELFLPVILTGPPSTFVLAVAEVTRGTESSTDDAEESKA
jgi:hypothetical protein